MRIVGAGEMDDLWKAVNDLRAAVGDLTGLMREIRAMLNERCDVRAKALSDLESRVAKTDADHEARLRFVEQKIWWVSGGAVCLTLVANWLLRK